MVEEVFQTGPEEVNDKDVVKTFLAEVVYIRNASYSDKQVSRTAKEVSSYQADGVGVLTAAY